MIASPLLYNTVIRNINRYTIRRASNNKREKVFDQEFRKLIRDGAARSHTASLMNSSSLPSESFVEYDYLNKEIATRLIDRLDDIKFSSEGVEEKGFSLALDVGAGAGYLHRVICSDDALNDAGGGIGGVKKIVELDSSNNMLHRDDCIEIDGIERCGNYKLVAKDEDENLPFPDETFDLVLSCNSIHHVNDIEFLLKEIKRVLKPNGCFISAIIGGSTLSELRSSFILSEMERDGGVSPHVGPFIDFADVGSLLTNAGFTLPTVDIDTITLSYPNAMVLMEHLQRMGESNACIGRRKRVNVDTFLAAASIYQEMFSLDADDDEEIEATVQVIYAIGWTPHESQQKPLQRGSATHKMVEISKVKGS